MMKKEELNVRNNHWVKAPIVLGLSAALCMPAAFSYANVGDRTDLVQSVLQSRTVKGQILDENGEPLIGVSVVVKGASTVGTLNISNSSSYPSFDRRIFQSIIKI